MGWGIFGSISHDISHAVTDTVKEVTKTTSAVKKDVYSGVSKLDTEIVKPVEKDVRKYTEPVSKDINSGVSKLESDVSNGARKTGGYIEHVASGFATAEITGFKKREKQFNTVEKTVSGDIKNLKKKVSSVGAIVSHDVSGGLHTVASDVNKGANTIKKDATGLGKDVEHDAEDAGHDIYKAGDDIYGGLKDIGDWFSKYWEIIVAVIIGVILLIVFVFAKAGGHVL